MGLPRSAISSGRPPVRASALARTAGSPPSLLGHGHWRVRRRALSRRQAIQAAGGLVLAGFAAGGGRRAFAQDASGADPKPIPPGFELNGQHFHVYLNEPGNEPSTITDFRGLVAINHLQGEGTIIRGGPNGGLATPTTTGDRIGYDVDMRIMKGTYIGEDGQAHEGAFGFI
jgi:hypothetical protein